MRCMLIHKTDAHWEAGAKPTPELIARVGGMIGGMAEAGIFLGGEGLGPSSQGVRLHFSGGRRTVTPGPFQGSNENPSGYAILRASSIDDAIGWASRYAGVVGTAEIDLRPVNEPWDLGFAPKPPGLATRRFMAIPKADRRTESGVPLGSKQAEDLKRLIDETMTSGLLLTSGEFRPSSKGVRFKFTGGRFSKTDGPFVESKEMIGGFVILKVDSLEAALPWAERYAAAVGDIELDMRPLSD